MSNVELEDNGKIKDNKPFNSYKFLIPSTIVIILCLFLLNSDLIPKKTLKSLEMYFILIALSFIFFWIGTITAISFMEAWLKFKSPLLTKKVGVSVGRRVFYGLNLLESISMTSILCLFLLAGVYIPLAFYFTILVILIDFIWLQPTLDLKAREIIENGQSKSNQKWPHFLYVAGEFSKLVLLIKTGIYCFNLINTIK